MGRGYFKAPESKIVLSLKSISQNKEPNSIPPRLWFFIDLSHWTLEKKVSSQTHLFCPIGLLQGSCTISFSPVTPCEKEKHSPPCTSHLLSDSKSSLEGKYISEINTLHLGLQMKLESSRFGRTLSPGVPAEKQEKKTIGYIQRVQREGGAGEKGKGAASASEG